MKEMKRTVRYKWLGSFLDILLPTLRSHDQPQTRSLSRHAAPMKVQTLTLSLAATLTAIGVALSPFVSFPFLGTRATPVQHFVNALAGVLIGPWWAAIVAILIGLIRNTLGVGTIFAFPGGIPGALAVGLAYRFTKRFQNRLSHFAAALFEPIGTVFVGATVSLLVIAPLVGFKPLLATIDQFGVTVALLTLWGGWALNSVSGCVLGYFVHLALDRLGLPTRRR